MKEVLALWRMELSRVDEQLGDKETDSEFSSSPMFSEEISDFPKKGHGAEAIGAITELLMATGRTPAFQAAVEAWLNMYREEGLLCCERWIPETQKSEQIPKHIHKFSEICENFESEFWRSKTAVACSYTRAHLKKTEEWAHTLSILLCHTCL